MVGIDIVIIIIIIIMDHKVDESDSRKIALRELCGGGELGGEHHLYVTSKLLKNDSRIKCV